MTYPRRLSAQLLDKDATTVISGALDQAFGLRGMDETNGYGSGEIFVPLSSAGAAQVRRGRYVQCLLEGVPFFTFKIGGHPAYRQVMHGERLEEVLACSGQGWGCCFEGANVYPDGGLALVSQLDYSNRLFSFASRTFPNLSGWGAAVERYEYLDGVTYGARVVQVENTGPDPDDPGDDEVLDYPAPLGFPWPNAPKNGNGAAPTPTYVPTYWVTGSGAPSEESIGFHFFRGSFTLAGSQEVKITVTADNFYTLFLNGIPILGDDENSLAWQEWREITLTLPAGTHVFAAVVENIEADVDYNPAGFLFAAIAMAVYPGEVATTETLALLVSDAASFTSAFTDDEFPGYTPGQIIDIVVDEAQARGALSHYTDHSFGELVDSDGNPWDSVDPESSTLYVPVFPVKLSDSAGDVLRGLYEQGWIDWHFTPDVLALDAWAQGAVGTATGVEFSRATNIIGLERGETDEYANALLVQWSAGYTEVNDADEIEDYGDRVEAFLSTDAGTVFEAQRLGRVDLRRRAFDERVAVLLTIEPRDSTECPYEGFGMRDTIEVTNVAEDGFDTSRVLAIHFEQDDLGYAAPWRLEVNERWRSPEAEAVSLLRSVGGRTLGSVADHGVAKD